MLQQLSRELHAWRLMHTSANKLVRPVDRIETFALVVVTIAAAVGFAVSLIIGSSTYTSVTSTIDHQAPRHSVVATITKAPARLDMPTTVRWTQPDGRSMSAQIGSFRTDIVGGTRTLWVDDSGTVVNPPRTAADALVDALIATAATTLLVVLGWWLLTAAIRRLLQRSRYRVWENEWRDLDINSHH